MNTEQLARLLTALEAIAVGTGRIADALEAQATPAQRLDQHLRVTVTPTPLNPKGPYA